MRLLFVAFSAFLVSTAALAEDAVFAVQSQLRALGYQPGPSDGAMGPGTRGAIEAFYSDRAQITPEDAAEIASDLTQAVRSLRRSTRPAPLHDLSAFPTQPRRPLLLAKAWDRVYFADVFRRALDLDEDGKPEMIAVKAMYDPRDTALRDVVGKVGFFQPIDRPIWVDTLWQEIPDLIQNPEDFCLHPRGIATGRFNADNTPDVFIACHGFDAPPHAGERNRILLSQPDGTFRVSEPSPDVGFFHGVAAEDFDADGDLDVIVTTLGRPHPLVVLLNDGTGRFEADTSGQFVPRDIRRAVFTISLPDMNGDGLFDMFVGGHDWENGLARVFLNDGSNQFRQARAISVPTVPGYGVVLDAAMAGEGDGRALWILRTSGGGGSYYEGNVLQRFEFAARTATEMWRNETSRWEPFLFTWEKDGVQKVGMNMSRPAVNADPAN